MTPAEFDATLTLSAGERLVIEATSAAMAERAEVFERAIAARCDEILALRETEHGLAMLADIAGVIALEQLRCSALGVSEPTWEHALRRYGILIRETTDSLKNGIRQQEAMQ